MKEYALYKGEQILSIGSIKEIAIDQSIKTSTVRFYGCSAYLKRVAARKKSNKYKILISLDDEEDD